MSKRVTNTDKLELVETHNIYLALHRLRDKPSYCDQRWRRALYHALTMEMPDKTTTMTNIRAALELP